MDMRHTHRLHDLYFDQRSSWVPDVNVAIKGQRRVELAWRAMSSAGRTRQPRRRHMLSLTSSLACPQTISWTWLGVNRVERPSRAKTPARCTRAAGGAQRDAFARRERDWILAVSYAAAVLLGAVRQGGPSPHESWTTHERNDPLRRLWSRALIFVTWR